MKSSGMKFYVYFVIVAFVALFIQGAYITVHHSDGYVFTESQSSSQVIITASSLREMTEQPQITQIGNVAWAIIGVSFAVGIAAAFVIHPVRLFSRRKRASSVARPRAPAYSARSYRSGVSVISSGYTSARMPTRKVSRPYYTLRTSVPNASSNSRSAGVVKKYWA